MSRLLIIFLSIALLGNAGAAVSGLYTYDINPDNVSVTITDYPTSAAGAIEIPATIDGRSVTSIGDYAFYNFSSLTSVIIPDSVTSIGNDAFYNCSSLTSVTIPDSVTSIGSGAFRECSGLASVTIGNSVTSIGIYAFYGCSGLTSVTIPDSVTSIGSRAFYSCTNLASISFQSMAAPTIGSDAFLSISAAAIIYYPYGATGYAATYDGVPTTDDGSVQPFDGYNYEINPDNVSVTITDYPTSAAGAIEIPATIYGRSVTSIGDYAFYNFSSLTSVIIPDSVTSIGDYAFGYCGSLTSVTIGNSVTSIGDGAFYNCYGLTSVIIPDSVTSIGSGAFYNCSNLASIRLQSIVAPGIGPSAFVGISATAMLH
ncbi:MAG: leucine-rich repeat domain-containing protein, partial [Opitutae bacterium]|nr:leucine-rich repeat domain-containing protein [Opitutae bacterium]